MVTGGAGSAGMLAGLVTDPSARQGHSLGTALPGVTGRQLMVRHTFRTRHRPHSVWRVHRTTVHRPQFFQPQTTGSLSDSVYIALTGSDWIVYFIVFVL